MTRISAYHLGNETHDKKKKRAKRERERKKCCCMNSSFLCPLFFSSFKSTIGRTNELVERNVYVSEGYTRLG